MKWVSVAMALALSACAAFPELDGKPTGPIRAADLRRVEAPVWTLDFGDGGLRRMLAEADIGGLDVLTARARARAADLSLSQVRAGGLPQVTASGSRSAAGSGGDGGASKASYSASISASWDPDLSGRLEAAIRAAQLEAGASNADVVAARRTLAREIVTSWVALAEARNRAARAEERATLAERTLALQTARASGGETTAADVTARSRRLIEARVAAAEASGQIAVAEARLRALGARQVPGSIALRGLSRPPVPARSDLGGLDHRPDVCASWLRFRAADASRAEALRAARPRLVISGSLASAAKTLAGLAAGNAAALSHSLSLDGALFDGGQSRTRVDQSRLSQAQAEIGWLQARSRAEVSLLETVVERHGAEAQLDAALKAYAAAEAERARARARHDAGVADGLELADAEAGLTDAQAEVDAARARTFRAAASWADAQGLPGLCGA